MVSAAAVVGGLTTYLLGKRRASGNIETSEASALWKESQEMRRELREELVALRGTVEEQDREIQRLRERVALLERTLQTEGIPVP